MATANVFLKTSKLNKAGEAPVKIMLYNDGKKREKSLGLRLRPDQWDSTKRCVRKNHPQSTRLNKLIAQERSKYLELAVKLESGEKGLQNGGIDQLLNEGGNMDVRELLLSKANEFGKSGQVSSWKLCRETANRLTWFMESVGLKELRIVDLKRRIKHPETGEKKMLLDAYMQYLRDVRGNSTSTVTNFTEMIRVVVNDQVRKGLLSPVHKPYFHLPKGKPRMDHLTPEQIQAFIGLDLSVNSKLSLARDLYLFSALGGGLRFVDVLKLQWQHIDQGGKLSMVTQKTKSRVHMGLGQFPLQIVQKYRQPNAEVSDFVFPVLPADFLSLDPFEQHRIVRCKNSRMNYALQRLAKRLGVTHSMSFHTARHTFATMAVSKGMKITTLQRILGHGQITQTQKYWHLLGKD